MLNALHEKSVIVEEIQPCTVELMGNLTILRCNVKGVGAAPD
jgi:hypothetical protein